MKKIFLATLLFAITAGAANAQVANKEKNKGQHQMRKSGGHGKSFEKLNLTEAQKTQIASIREKQRQELDALKKNDQMTVANWKEQRKALHEKYKAQYSAILTQQQKDQLQQLRAERGNRQGSFARFNGAGLGKMAQELNITDAQKQKLTAIGQDFRTKAQAIRSNTALTADQRKEQMKSLMTQHQNQAKTVLTKEQVEKLENMKKQRKNRFS